MHKDRGACACSNSVTHRRDYALARTLSRKVRVQQVVGAQGPGPAPHLPARHSGKVPSVRHGGETHECRELQGMAREGREVSLEQTGSSARY